MRNPKDICVLIVDDEEALRKALIFDFKRKGLRTLEAENGTQAFKLIQENAIDVVLTDVRMPGGDGIELLDKIKHLNPELPVVMFITGFADITLEEAFDKGVDAVFAKPFERKELFASVFHSVKDKNEQWRTYSSKRINTNFPIELSFANSKAIAPGKVVNIGRGGAFVAMNSSFPQLHSQTKFRITFEQELLEGEGIVRWIRTEKNQDGPAGCGIEFLYLNDRSRQQAIELIKKLKTKSYIPRA